MSSIEKIIGELLEAVEKGQKATQKASGKKILVVVGNTGSGKSTAINYIEGCEMEMEKLEGKPKRVVRVKPTSKILALMAIGHGKNSETFIPQVENGFTGLTYMDCPGFFDNRGFATNVANTVNIKNAVFGAHSVFLLILINFHILEADRQRGLGELMKIASDFFGSFEKLLANKKSILIAVTHIRMENESYNDLHDMKTIFNEDKMASKLVDRVVTFDPLDEPLEGGCNRKRLLEKISELEPITNCQHMFNTILVAEDLAELIRITREIVKRMGAVLTLNPNVNYK